VLVLQGDTYATRGIYHAGEHATSVILDGFSVNVDEVFGVR
jgi:hypothetical protein